MEQYIQSKVKHTNRRVRRVTLAMLTEEEEAGPTHPIYICLSSDSFT